MAGSYRAVDLLIIGMFGKFCGEGVCRGGVILLFVCYPRQTCFALTVYNSPLSAVLGFNPLTCISCIWTGFFGYVLWFMKPGLDCSTDGTICTYVDMKVIFSFFSSFLFCFVFSFLPFYTFFDFLHSLLINL